MDNFQTLLSDPLLIGNIEHLKTIRNNLIIQLETELDLNQTILTNLIRFSNFGPNVAQEI
jgi:hypothetical protein